MHRNGNMHDNSHYNNQIHTSQTHNKSTHTPPFPTTSNLTTVCWGNNIPAPNLTANTTIPTKPCIVRIWHKDHPTPPQSFKQLHIPSHMTAPDIPFQNPDQKGHLMDNPMHQPKLNIKPTHSILPASTSASISHTTDAQFQTPKQNPPTGSQPTISPTTNDHQQSANIATQQSPDCEGTHSCNNAEPSSLTQMAITHIQNYPMPYLCAYWT